MSDRFQLRHRIEEADVSIRKFPASFLIALLWVVWLCSDREFSLLSFFSYRLSYGLAIIYALPTSIGVHLVLRHWTQKKWQRQIVPVLISLLLVPAFEFFLRRDGDLGSVDLPVIFAFFALLHLLVSLAIGRRSEHQFWQFNHSMLVGFIYASFVSLLVAGGIGLGLFMIKTLFSLGIKEDVFIRTIGSVSVLAHVMVFLSCLHRVDEEKHGYPRYLRLTLEYVLFPLGTAYFVILSIYIVRSLMTVGIPNGMLGGLISGIGVIGILSFLLAHPMDSDLPKSALRTWIKILNLWLMVLGCFAIDAALRRIEYSGITESRWYLLALSIWVTGISLWRAASWKFSIQMVPLSLAVVLCALLFSGPYSAKELSIKSQSSRLQLLLDKKEWTEKERYSAETIVKVLSRMKQASELTKIADQRLESFNRSQKTQTDESQINFSVHPAEEFATGGLENMARIETLGQSGSRSFRVIRDDDKKLKVVSGSTECALGLDEVIKKMSGKPIQWQAAEHMRVETRCSNRTLVFQFDKLVAVLNPDGTVKSIQDYSGFVFY